MNETCNRECPFMIAVKSLAELVLVIAGTLGLIYGLEQLAEYRANRPAVVDATGRLVLPASQASLQGSLQGTPRVLEDQRADFDYNFGPRLAKERASRTVSHWADPNDSVAWQIQTLAAGDYQIEVECAADPQEAGGEFEVILGDQRLTAKVPDTGGAEAWRVEPVGRLRIDSGTYTLAIKPVKITGKTLMGLKSVVLQKE